MENINIELTPKQYKKLIETVFLGTWMVNSTKMEIDEEFEEVRELILAKYHKAGIDQEIIHQEAADIYDLDVDYESRLLEEYVEDYDEFSFWDKLIEKLAEKEMVEEFGAPDGEMTEEMMVKRIELEEEIGRRLEETGVTNLTFANKE